MKQRLVGTIVLGSLALIVIPVLLDGDGVETPPLATSMPPAPLVDTTPVPQPERPEIIADQLATTPLTPPVIVPATTGFVPAPADAAASAEPVTDAGVAAAPTAPDASGTAMPPGTSPGPAPASVAEASGAQPAPQTQAVPEPATAPTAATPPEPPAAAAAPTATVATAPRLTAGGVPEAWTIRLGTFGDRANADALVANLVLANHKAYLRPVGAGGQTLFGVFVGPVVTRAEANTLQKQLAADFKLNGIVQNFTVEAPR